VRLDWEAIYEWTVVLRDSGGRSEARHRILPGSYVSLCVALARVTACGPSPFAHSRMRHGGHGHGGQNLPAGFALVSMSGPGWSYSANTCTRADSLSVGASYPPIKVTRPASRAVALHLGAALCVVEESPGVHDTGGGSSLGRKGDSFSAGQCG
jgi:hypothetical protein